MNAETWNTRAYRYCRSARGPAIGNAVRCHEQRCMHLFRH